MNNLKHPAGALIYTLFILVIMSCILTILIFLFKSSFQIHHTNLNNIHKNDIVDSAFELLLSPEYKKLGSEDVSLFEDDSKSAVKLSLNNWGLFQIAHVEHAPKDIEYSKTGILISSYKPDEELKLYNVNNEISLAGNTRLYGKLFLPTKGLKRAYLNNYPYINEKLDYGKILSPSSEMELSFSILKRIKDVFNPASTDSIINKLSTNQKVNNLFNNKTLTYQSKRKILLTKQEISGNVIIKSSTEVFLSKESLISNIIIIAPYVEIESGFSGDCQVFATDSIKIGENVSLNYLSNLILQANNPSAHIQIGKGFSMDGQIISLSNEEEPKEIVKTIFDECLDFKGTIYTDGYLQLSGNYSGSIYAKRVIFQTQSSTHMDHICNAVINKVKLDSSDLYVDLFNDNPIKSVLEWK